MSKVFVDDKYIYSIEMINAYINLFKFETINININKLLFNLDLTHWDCKLQPITVINNIQNKKYKEYIDKINESNITDPIIINEQNVVIDGIYILAKNKLENKNTIKVYIIDSPLMKQFRILKINEINKIKTLKISDYIEKFVKNVIISKIDKNMYFIKN